MAAFKTSRERQVSGVLETLTLRQCPRELNTVNRILQKYEIGTDRSGKCDRLHDAQENVVVISYISAAIAVTNSDLR